MKDKLKNILYSILNSKENFCSLCFTGIQDQENSLNLNDQVIFENEHRKSIVEILSFILSPGVSNNLITKYICLQCAKSTLSSYVFIKMIKNNSEYLSSIVNNLDRTANSANEENLEHMNTMYLLNESLTFQCYYDTKLKRDTILSVENAESFISIKLVPEEGNIMTISHNIYNTEKSISRDTVPLKNKKINSNTLTDMCEKDSEKNVKCKICFKVYHTMTNFRSHYNRLHAPKTIKCPKCPKLFGSTTILKQHRKESHFDAICAECGKTFNNYSYLKIHELSHRVCFTCATCKRVYKTKETFNKHLSLKICSQKQRKSRLEAQFTCDICNKKFCRKPSLRVHIMLEHGNSKHFVCHCCHKRFSAQSHLNNHITKHTQAKNYTCTICFGKFSTKEGLKIHSRLHSGERPYQCSDCNASFISSSQRLIHRNRYHNFVCDMCCSKFDSKISYTNHKKLNCVNNDLNDEMNE